MLLPKGYIPSDYDVICGRGRGNYNQPGNKKFRVIIMSHLHEYKTLKNKIDKSIFFNKVIDIVKSQTTSQHDVHFIRQVSSSCHNTSWMILNDEQAREKVGHAIREALSPRSCNNNTNSSNSNSMQSKIAIAKCRDVYDDDSDCNESSINTTATTTTINITSSCDDNSNNSNNKLSSKSNTDAVAPITTSLFRHSTDVILSNVMKLFNSNDCIDPIPVTSSSSEAITNSVMHNESYNIKSHMTPVVSDYTYTPSCTTTNHNNNSNNNMWIEYQLNKKESKGLDLLLDDDILDSNITNTCCEEPVSIHELNYSVSMTLAGLLHRSTSKGLDLLLDDDDIYNSNNNDTCCCDEPVSMNELNYSVSMSLVGFFNQIKKSQRQSSSSFVRATSSSSFMRATSSSSSSHNSIIDCFAV